MFNIKYASSFYSGNGIFFVTAPVTSNGRYLFTQLASPANVAALEADSYYSSH
jgi:hypothetical protein